MSDSAPVPAASVPAGWFQDPHDSTQNRYWNGSVWTDHRSPLVKTALQPTVQQTVVVGAHPPTLVVQSRGHGMLVRTAWYVFVGWWLSGLLMFAAGLCIATVLLIPVGLALVNRLPAVLTLRPATQRIATQIDAAGQVQMNLTGAQQRAMWQRAVYFVVAGWWVCLLSMSLAWLLSVTIIGLPLGLMLLNRIPAATTLRRN